MSGGGCKFQHVSWPHSFPWIIGGPGTNSSFEAEVLVPDRRHAMPSVNGSSIALVMVLYRCCIYHCQPASNELLCHTVPDCLHYWRSVYIILLWKIYVKDSHHNGGFLHQLTVRHFIKTPSFSQKSGLKRCRCVYKNICLHHNTPFW